MKEDSWMEKNMALEYIIGLMDQLMRDGILMTKSTVMVDLSQKIIKSSKENGLMAKDREEEC